MIVVLVSGMATNDRGSDDEFSIFSIDNGRITWTALPGAPVIEVFSIRSITLREVVVPLLGVVPGVKLAVVVDDRLLPCCLKEPLTGGRIFVLG